MKQICTRCKKPKDVKTYKRCFPKTDNPIKKKICIDCLHKYSQAYYRRLKIKGEHLKYNKSIKARNRKFVENFKKLNKCLKCGESNPCCLDFHHLHSKKMIISKAVERCWSIKKLKLEMEKCILLCANCHRKEHKRNQ